MTGFSAVAATAIGTVSIRPVDELTRSAEVKTENDYDVVSHHQMSHEVSVSATYGRPNCIYSAK